MLRIQPDEGVTLRFGAKVPGTQMEIRDVNMDFAYGEAFTESSPEAYERLILDVLLGDPPLFPQHEEVELSWEILDPVLDYWADLSEQPQPYEPGSWGPRMPRRCSRGTASAGGGHDHQSGGHDVGENLRRLIRVGAVPEPGPGHGADSATPSRGRRCLAG